MVKRRLHFHGPADVDPSKPFYLVEYDFKDPHDPRRSQFYTELHNLLRRRLEEVTSTRSVLPVGSKELAFRIKELVIEHGGIANIYEAKLVEE